MSRVPSLSRHALNDLAPKLLPSAVRRANATPVERAFITLQAARDSQNRALTVLDRALAPAGDPSADAAHLAAARRSADQLGDEVADLAAVLLLAPIERISDLRFKLAVLIAASEPHPADARVFPALYLRALLADVGLEYP